MTDVVRQELMDDPTIDITTVGRRSGLLRTIEIWMMAVEDRFFITGTPGPRDWLANLRENPQLVVHLKRKTTLDLTARASEVTDEPTRRRVIEHLTASWYRGQAPVEDLVANAPMVEITFSMGQ